MNPINCITRPNLHKLNVDELLQIIKDIETDCTNTNTRSELVDKIFKLWSEHELSDHLTNPIECLICTERLTNGNNLTFACGYKFHSGCVVKHLLIYSTDSYINYTNDDEMKSLKLEYFCPQCKLPIDFIEFSKK
jgi:hypothetical protein